MSSGWVGKSEEGRGGGGWGMEGEGRGNVGMYAVLCVQVYLKGQSHAIVGEHDENDHIRYYAVLLYLANKNFFIFVCCRQSIAHVNHEQSQV